MQHLALTILLADQRQCQRPCGAVAERPFGLCRKCRDRNAWRHKSATTRREATRRRTRRRTHTHNRPPAATITGMED
jgi:predicted ATP-dependent serine protease